MLEGRRMLCAAIVAAGAMVWPAARAEEGSSTPDGATLYRERTCIACHGPDAKTPILPEYPKTAGQNAAYLFQQMKDIKSGARDNGLTAVMKPTIQNVSEEEMKIMADWLAQQRRFAGGQGKGGLQIGHQTSRRYST